MGHSIGVDRWITVAEEEIRWVDGALTALGGVQADESLELYDLANLNDVALAKYLRNLAATLRTVAANLAHLADHADLTELAESLKSSSNDTTGEGA